MTSLTSAVQTAIVSDVYQTARFVTISFPGNIFRMWSGIGPFTLGGNVYQGAGSLGTLGTITDTTTDGVSTFNSQRLTMSLSGLDTTLAAQVNSIDHQGSPVEIIEAQIDSTGAVIPNSYDIFLGEVDTMAISLGATLDIAVQCENYLSFAFRGPDGRRRTTADQEDLFPGDKGLEFDGSLPPDIPWGIAGGATIPSASATPSQASLTGSGFSALGGPRAG
jgi:hypothetical protein